jgi:hypothetical protein
MWCVAVAESAIRRFWSFEQRPPAAELKIAAQRSRPPKSNFKKLSASPTYKAGHGLRSYQLEGLNWLLFSWYNRRSVMLADEMGAPPRLRACERARRPHGPPSRTSRAAVFASRPPSSRPPCQIGRSPLKAAEAALSLTRRVQASARRCSQ